jgi:hypothetical protein
MIELVLWSCVLGFTPIALFMGSKSLALLAGLVWSIAARQPAFFHDDRVAPCFGPHRIDRAGGFGHGG